MGDMGEDFAGMREATRLRHATWKRNNMTALQASEFPFRVSNNSETILFRETDKPMVDFYPSTGRWRVVGGVRSQTFRGGAEKFLRWYRKAEATKCHNANSAKQQKDSQSQPREPPAPETIPF